MRQIPSLNIIGAGRLGQTLAKLFHTNECFNIHGICNSTVTSAQKAVDFIGAGLACDGFNQLPPADVLMITTPDGILEKTVHALVNIPAIQQSKVIFHCSGVTTSAVLSPLKHPTMSVASMHPNMTFASAAMSVSHFAGTYCAFEGENAAFELLENVFRKIGAKVFQISADKKPIYHAATAMSCNHLIALLDVAVQLYLKTGVTREVALAIMQPMVNKTISNVFSLDTVEALTGPIARGDVHTVRQHFNALEDSPIKDIYKSLGLQLIRLSADKGNANQQQLDEIRNILNS